MKEKLALFCIFLVITLSFCSCTSYSKDKTTSSMTTTESVTREFETNSFSGDTYEYHSYPDFKKAMQENKIDKSERLGPTSSLTFDLISHYNKYIVLWEKEEMHSLTNIEYLLNDKDYDELVKSQNIWKSSQEKRREVDYNILSRYFGRELSLKRLQQGLVDARERTIYVKFMTYMLENMENNDIPKDKQKWNVFLSIDL